MTRRDCRGLFLTRIGLPGIRQRGCLGLPLIRIRLSETAYDQDRTAGDCL